MTWKQKQIVQKSKGNRCEAGKGSTVGLRGECVQSAFSYENGLKWNGLSTIWITVSTVGELVLTTGHLWIPPTPGSVSTARGVTCKLLNRGFSWIEMITHSCSCLSLNVRRRPCVDCMNVSRRVGAGAMFRLHMAGREWFPHVPNTASKETSSVTTHATQLL